VLIVVDAVLGVRQAAGRDAPLVISVARLRPMATIKESSSRRTRTRKAIDAGRSHELADPWSTSTRIGPASLGGHLGDCCPAEDSSTIALFCAKAATRD